MNDDQTAHELWNKIISTLLGSPEELVTIKQNGTKGIWFLASMNNGNLLISKAKINRPSSNVTVERQITEAEFIRTYPYYFRWRNHESGIRQEAVRLASQNTSYIFALISYYG